MGVRRPDLVLFCAAVVSLPVVWSFLDGGMSLAAALVRVAIAIALCWGAGAATERVYDTYARQVRQEEIRRAVEEARRRFGSPEETEPAADSDASTKLLPATPPKTQPTPAVRHTSGSVAEK